MYRKTNLIILIMKQRIYKISREKAIQLTMNHNCVSYEIASNYSDSELKEVLKHLSSSLYKMVANF